MDVLYHTEYNGIYYPIVSSTVVGSSDYGGRNTKAPSPLELQQRQPFPYNSNK